MSDAEFYLPLYGDPYGVPGTGRDMPLLDALARMQAVNGLVAITLRGLDADGWQIDPWATTRTGAAVMLAGKTFPTTAQAEAAEQAANASYRKQARTLGLGDYIDALDTAGQVAA